MGTDIHAFIEVDYANDGEPFGEWGTVRCFNLGELFLWHNYKLFDALGNGRSRHFPPESVERWALFPPRGLPHDVSHNIVGRYSYPIVDPTIDSDKHHKSHERSELPSVTPEEAARWVAEGWSHYYTAPVERFSSTPGLPRVSHPDWRNASWLLLPEIRQALAHFDLELEELSPEVEAILSVMETFEGRLGSGRSRLVFWFDN